MQNNFPILFLIAFQALTFTITKKQNGAFSFRTIGISFCKIPYLSHLHPMIRISHFPKYEAFILKDS